MERNHFTNSTARMHFMTISKESHRKVWEVTLICRIHFYLGSHAFRNKLPRNFIQRDAKCLHGITEVKKFMCCKTLQLSHIALENELRTAEKWKITTFAYSNEENMLVNCRHISCISSSSFSLFTEFQLYKLYTIMKDSAIKTVWNSFLLIKMEFSTQHISNRNVVAILDDNFFFTKFYTNSC